MAPASPSGYDRWEVQPASVIVTTCWDCTRGNWLKTGGKRVYWEQQVQCEAGTDIGLRRKNNEDSHCVHICQDEAEWRRGGHLMMVADGMGGHAVGELASRIAVETVPHTFLKSPPGDPRKSLHEAIIAANQAIYEKGTQNADFLHMGTTCTVLVLSSRGAIVGHVGDSRAYRVRRDRIDQLTFDHSLEWELERQHGNLAGIIDISQHKNVITRSLGPEKTIDVDVEGPFPILPGDVFVLCSDGLSNQVTDAEIGAIARELPPPQAVQLLLNLANIRGGPDNITVVVARVGDLPANVVPAPPEDLEDNQFELGWSWLIGYWVGALCLVCGLAMEWYGNPLWGTVLVALSLVGLLVLATAAVRHRRWLKAQLPAGDPKTHRSRPHRTAVSLASKELFDLLGQIDVELRRSAQEDGWEVKWNEHERAVAVAQNAAREKRFARGLRDLARAISIIMEELPRRTVDRNGARTN